MTNFRDHHPRNAAAAATRRHVLAISAGLAIGGVFAAPPAGARSLPMATRPIPHSGEQLPVVGLGTAANFSVGADEGRRAALGEVIERLIEGGGKLIDTASSYGAAEEVLGAIIPPEARGRLFLATKLENADMASGAPELRRSLDRLRTGQVALLQLHNVSRASQSLAAFRDWKAEGLCRYVGITTTSDRDYAAAEAILRREKPDFLQVDYSLAERKAETRLLPAAAEVGAAVLTALPFGRRSIFRAVAGRTLPDWAEAFDAATWPQFFLKYLLGHEAVTAVIPGTGNPDHMADNLAAGRGRLPDAAQRRAMAAFFDAL
ncbi:MAG: aldo/keto reductase [Rhizobiales bacterium]|nr:aldo/keto reductase [Hyphomicrobiales bacterium]